MSIAILQPADIRLPVSQTSTRDDKVVKAPSEARPSSLDPLWGRRGQGSVSPIF